MSNKWHPRVVRLRKDARQRLGRDWADAGETGVGPRYHKRAITSPELYIFTPFLNDGYDGAHTAAAIQTQDRNDIGYDLTILDSKYYFS